jgi:hypothetical protein
LKAPARLHRRAELGGPAVIALTTEDDQRPEVRQAAQAHARAHGCDAILYATDVASSWSEPMPNQWASEGEADRFGDRLSSEDLDALGRSAISGQVRKARRAGARGAGWLPKDKGVEALAEYAASEGAHIVYVPESLDAIDALRALLANAGQGHGATTSDVELRVVGDPVRARAKSAQGDAPLRAKRGDPDP